MSKTTETPTHLEEVIDLTLHALEQLDPKSEDFAHVTDQLTKLHAMLPKKEPAIKPDVLLSVFGNLAGILAILGYEQTHVVTSKALGFVLKPHF